VIWKVPIEERGWERRGLLIRVSGRNIRAFKLISLIRKYKMIDKTKKEVNDA